jgi:ATP-binding cassette subfamily B protein
MEAMTQLMLGRTTFMIAHRLSTLEQCDVRLKIEQGHVIDTMVVTEIKGDGNDY